MKKTLLLLSALLPVMAWSQVITTSPAIITQSSKDITITFHADGGNKGLMSVGAGGAVYAHTGVTTQAGSWKHATNWGTNSDKYKLTYTAPYTWTLTIPDMSAFYGTTASETISQLDFVFRNANGTSECKTALGGDIFVEVFPDGFPSSTEAAYDGGTLKLGPTANADGSVTFGFAAPSCSNVLLVGSWNNYAVTPDQVMNYQSVDGNRWFWTTVPALADGKDYCYYFLVDGATRVGDPYARLVLDPNGNDSYISSTVFPDMPAYPSAAVSKVPVAVYNSSWSDYAWKVDNFKGVPQDQLIIYEILVRDFTGTDGKALGSGTIAAAMEKLDYIKSLGVNAVELMPIMEFSGNNSWGYNPNFYFAPDKAYGTPAAYKAFIDAAHERGLAVILDIVFNQADVQHPWLDMYRQCSPERFFNGSAPHSYSVFYDWNQGNDLVQKQWNDALDYWMTEYRADGFRFDLVKGLGDSDSYGTAYDAASNTYATPSESNTNKYNATRVARMKALRDHAALTNPDLYFINEDLAGAQEENDMAADGEINWANINYAACQYAMGYTDGSSLDRFYAPLDDGRIWGSTVSYAESHDEERVAYKVVNYAANGIIGNINVQMRRLGSLAAQMLMCPGAHMIWQFEELGDAQSTKSSSGDNNTAPKKVVWNYLQSAPRQGLRDTYAALCGIRADYPYMFDKSAACKVSLGSNTARFLSLASADGSELYLVVNPAASPTATAVVSPLHASTGAAVDLTAEGFECLASSYDSAPVSVTASGVTLYGGAFAVYGRGLHSGINSIIADSCNKSLPKVTVSGGVITPEGDYATFTIHDISGKQLPTASPLAPGLYLVTIDNTTIKVMVD